MTPPTNKRTASWLINGALIAGSLVFALLLAEIALRLIGFSEPVWWTYDDITGSKLNAGAQGWYRSEGEAFISVNSDGLRDREHSRTKPPNTVRIAILGASMAEALQVPVETTFWSVLERELKSCKAFAGRNVEVINFGVSGYNTAQELLTFRNRAAAYAPDVTVLAFSGSDVRNNSKELEPLSLSPFFSVQNGKLVLDNSFLSNPKYLSLKSNFEQRKILFNMRTFQLIRKLKRASDQGKAGTAGAAPEVNIELGLDNNMFLAPTTEAWQDAWQITERLIAAIRDDVVAGGGRFLVLSIPFGIQVDPNPEARNRFIHKLKVDDLWYPETRIREFAAREKIDALTSGPAYRLYAEKNQIYLHGFKNTRFGTGHLNENGHKLLGEAMAKHLCQFQ